VIWVKWKLILVHLEVVLISTRDWFTFCAERAIGSKSFWAHPMGLLRDMSQIKARFGPFGGSVNLHIRLVHDLRRTCYRLRNRFGHTRWNS
jgi:hypothetical protein